MFSNAVDDEEEEDEGFDEDLEALRRACFLTGTDPSALQHPSSSPADGATALGTGTDSDSDEDDLELIRGIQQRCAEFNHGETPLFLKPLSTLPPASASDDEDEDDFETLRAIQSRFSGYDKAFPKRCTEENFFSNELEDALLEKEIASIGFPNSAQMFVGAIKKNMACQKFIRSKMIEIEARMEENRKLQQRVKILKDFQVSCKRRTGLFLSQKKDARVQLISSPMKPRANSKVSGRKRKLSALYCYGPDENPHVANYRMVLTKFPTSFSREKWTDAHRENLAKGIKQQFQELLLQKSVDLVSDQSGDWNDADSIVASIRDVDLTPENIRSFLPKVNWERLAAMYVPSHSGTECEARWLNYEDPLISHNQWTIAEEKKLLYTIEQRGINNWIDISVLLGTNRTPFQCLARYQRSLNKSILKSEWTEDEDEKLRAAVEEYGMSNWSHVATALEGRTGTQCSNRWLKSLNPVREEEGTWTPDEEKRLTVAVMLFGNNKTWKKVAQFVPGRTGVQCRERWCNVSDPSLNLGGWTEEEDSKFAKAISEHGLGHWAKVAKCVPPRTDNQCRRRWRELHPGQMQALQAVKKMSKAALITNFVDRESERPALGPNDFVPLALMSTIAESETTNHSREQKRKLRWRSISKGNGKDCRSNGPSIEAQICSTEVPLLSNGTEVQNFDEDDAPSKKKKVVKKRSEPTQDAVENGEEVRPFDGGTKMKKSFGKQKRKSRRNPEAKKIDTASRDDAISKKQMAMKPCSKKNKGTGPTIARSSDCADSDLLIKTNGEDGGERCTDASAKNKKAFKRGQRKRNCVKLLDESDEVLSLGEHEDISKKTQLEQDKHMDPTQADSWACADLTSTRPTNVDQDEAFGDDGARKKTSLKLHSKRSKYSGLLQGHSAITDIDEFDSLGGDAAILKKKRITRRSSNECNSLDNVASFNSFNATDKAAKALCENEATKKRKVSIPCLRSIRSDSPRRSKGLETSDTDNTTLHRKKRARIVHPTRKGLKRSVEHQNNTSSSVDVANLQAKQTETTNLKDRFQMTSFPEKCSTYVLSADEDLPSSGKRSRERGKTRSSDLLEAEDGDHMTLAFFMKHIVKRRRLRLAKESNNIASCHNMKGSELLQKENCCNDGRNNVLSSQAIQSEDSGGVVGGEIYFLEEPLSIDLGSFFQDFDDSDTCSPLPGFENLIYGRVLS